MRKKQKRERTKVEEVNTETLLFAVISMLIVICLCFGGNVLYLTLNTSAPVEEKKSEEKVPQYTRNNINYLAMVEKVDNNENIVYDAEQRETNRYPFININDEKISVVNDEIFRIQSEKVAEGKNITYEYGVFERFLTVTLVENDGECVKVIKNYVIDLSTSAVTTGKDIIDTFDNDKKYAMFVRIRNIVGAEFENELRVDDSNNLLRNETLENIYNYEISAVDNDVYLIVNVVSSNTCTKSLRINLNNYTYSYFLM